jgi:hypothetical protein
MHLVPKEVSQTASVANIPRLRPIQLDKLVISQLGLLAQRRLARGVKLNHAEATVRFAPSRWGNPQRL